MRTGSIGLDRFGVVNAAEYVLRHYDTIYPA